MKRLKIVIILACASQIFCTETSDHKQILQISIPKAGTNLLSKCISYLTGRQSVASSLSGEGAPRIFFEIYPEEFNVLFNLPSQYFLANHLLYSPLIAKELNKLNITTFFIYRDPRDQVISFAFFMKNGSNYWEKTTNMTFEEVLWDLISKGSTYDSKPPIEGNIRVVYDAYLAWINEPGVCVIKFEDLVGPNGGGDKDKQHDAIKKIAAHLGLSTNDEKVNQIAHDLFGGSWTFREGQIGSWKKYFTERHKEEFKKAAGQLLIDLGYEKDFNW